MTDIAPIVYIYIYYLYSFTVLCLVMMCMEKITYCVTGMLIILLYMFTTGVCVFWGSGTSGGGGDDLAMSQSKAVCVQCAANQTCLCH